MDDDPHHSIPRPSRLSLPHRRLRIVGGGGGAASHRAGDHRRARRRRGSGGAGLSPPRPRWRSATTCSRSGIPCASASTRRSTSRRTSRAGPAARRCGPSTSGSTSTGDYEIDAGGTISIPTIGSFATWRRLRRAAPVRDRGGADEQHRPRRRRPRADRRQAADLRHGQRAQPRRLHVRPRHGRRSTRSRSAAASSARPFGSERAHRRAARRRSGRRIAEERLRRLLTRQARLAAERDGAADPAAPGAARRAVGGEAEIEALLAAEGPQLGAERVRRAPRGRSRSRTPHVAAAEGELEGLRDSLARVEEQVRVRSERVAELEAVQAKGFGNTEILSATRKEVSDHELARSRLQGEIHQAEQRVVAAQLTREARWCSTPALRSRASLIGLGRGRSRSSSTPPALAAAIGAALRGSGADRGRRREGAGSLRHQKIELRRTAVGAGEGAVSIWNWPTEYVRAEAGGRGQRAHRPRRRVRPRRTGRGRGGRCERARNGSSLRRRSGVLATCLATAIAGLAFAGRPAGRRWAPAQEDEPRSARRARATPCRAWRVWGVPVPGHRPRRHCGLGPRPRRRVPPMLDDYTRTRHRRARARGDEAQARRAAAVLVLAYLPLGTPHSKRLAPIVSRFLGRQGLAATGYKCAVGPQNNLLAEHNTSGSSAAPGYSRAIPSVLVRRW